jgi:hypothetical protein
MPIGAIVGGVVGGISGVVAISLILTFFYNRRRKARNLKSTSTAVEEGKKAELPTRSSNQQKGAIELDHDQTRRNFAFELDGLGRGRLREKGQSEKENIRWK